MSKNIKIGWGRRSIAMDGPVPITGQMHLRVSQGVFSEVLVTALVLDNSDDAAVFVSADMVSISPALVKKVLNLLRNESPEIPADNLIINATHTHAGPSSNDINMDYPLHMEVVSSADTQDFLARQFADAVKEAWQNRSAGSIAYGYGFAVTGHSRRTIYLDDTSLRESANKEPGILVNGHGQMYGNTNDDMFDGYEAGTDPFINLMYTFDADGKLNGAVVNVPCPAQTNENAWVLHAGFWSNVREKLAAKYGNINIITQAAAGGDLSPRQMHYRAAELRRYKLKYPEKYADAIANPMRFHPDWFANDEEARIKYEAEAMDRMRAEDIAERIAAAFEEVLEWAQHDKMSAPEFKHEVRTVKLARKMFPEEQVEIEKHNLEQLRQNGFAENGGPLQELLHNSRQTVLMARCQGVIDRAVIQQQEPEITTRIHAVKIGNIAFVSNRFELFIDYMHRIQARSPFEQTFIVQLVGDEFGPGSYLATERAVYNRGYSATPYCNHVSPEGGQQLVNKTLDMLREIR